MDELIDVRRLNDEAIRALGADRLDEAVAAARAAVARSRELVDIDSSRFLPALAVSLKTLADVLGETGSTDEALPLIRAAVMHGRTLADVDRSFLPFLVAALNNLVVCTAAADRPEEAATAASEAVERCRPLVEEDRSTHLPTLVTALNSLSNALELIGDGEAALSAAREALALCRELVDSHPGTYLPDLAMSLTNLGLRMEQVGLGDEAVAPAREAVDHYRRLADEDRPAYLPDLAQALNNLSNVLAAAGRHDEALAVAEEAVEHYRSVVVTGDVHLAALAVALTTLARRLDRAGRTRRVWSIFGGVLTQLAGRALGTAHVTAARARWHADNLRTREAIDDLVTAMTLFDRVGDLLGHQRTRTTLRYLRAARRVEFDDTWCAAYGRLPGWLDGAPG